MAEHTVPSPHTGTYTHRPDQPSAISGTREQESTRAEEVFVAPPVDIYEDDEGLVVLADLPGIASEALEVRVDQRLPRATPSGSPLHREYELTGFFRQFQLPEEVDPARIQAELKQGVLTLRLPRAAAAEPRRIEVRTSD
jgi:HSP20 family molecular chaperone IbpA